jgi:RimJ/RimL family protein N-acetyltransferase
VLFSVPLALMQPLSFCTSSATGKSLALGFRCDWGATGRPFRVLLFWATLCCIMETLVPGPAYRIVTRRLVIRCWNPADAPLMKAAIDASLDHLRPWMPWAMDEPKPLQARIELLRHFRSEFDAGNNFIYGIFDRAETRVIGGTGLHTRAGHNAREIGYWIAKDVTHQGLATEVTAALTRVAFDVDRVDRVEIRIRTDNAYSAAIPPRLGYRHEATLRQRILGPDGALHDELLWTLFADEYPATPCAVAQLEACDAAGRRIL